MIDHANQQYLKRKITMLEHFISICDHICKIPPVAMVKKYRSYRRGALTMRASFWLSVNH